MDEIANYIADHQYNVALKEGETLDIDYRNIITQALPKPPFYKHVLHDVTFYEQQENIKKQELKGIPPLKVSPKLVEPYKQAREELRQVMLTEISKTGMLASPLGRYFLGLSLKLSINELQTDLSKGGMPKSYASFRKTISPAEIDKVLQSLDIVQEFFKQVNLDLISYKQVTFLLSPLATDSFGRQIKLMSDLASGKDALQTGKLKDEFLEKILAERDTVEEKLKCILLQTQKEMEDILSKTFSDFCNRQGLWVRYLCLRWYLKVRVPGIKDFQVFRKLGRGAFGVVSGARNVFTGKMVALKAMNRRVIKQRNCEDSVQAEKDILEMLGDSPSHFVVRLVFCFYDTENIYLALPLLTGGDLSYHLGKIFDYHVDEIAKDFHEDHEDFLPRLYQTVRGFAVSLAVFYSAEILLGILHLHSLGIVYRDLKPENILLSASGHLQISDLGLSVTTGSPPADEGRGACMNGRAGTPGYWCPEMIEGKKYGYECDWWAFGCTVYELLYAQNPFTESLTKLENRDDGTLKHSIVCPTLPAPRRDTVDENLGLDIIEGSGFEEKVQDLLDKLLCKKRERRLGSLKNPKEELMSHAFFESIDFEKSSALLLPPPWIPPNDTTNAESESTIRERNKDYKYKKGKLGSKDEDWVSRNVYVSELAQEKDIIEVLKLKASNKLDHLQEATSETKFCSIF